MSNCETMFRNVDCIRKESKPIEDPEIRGRTRFWILE
jgi:hypothetical protein